MKDAESRQQLLLRYLDGNLAPTEETQVANLLRSDPEARAFLRDVAEQAVTVADVERAEEGRRSELEARQDWAGNPRDLSGRTGIPRSRLARWSWAVAAASIVALMASLFFLRPNVEPEIAKITELSGSVQWTGDGGRVVHDLGVGSPLRGGTMESLSADSWGTLEFRDGTTVTISGQSMLTISEDQQKEIHLREGSMSANVAPQPRSQPMLIHTPTAKLEVLGTQLSVDAERTSTTLRVNEGWVRVTRLADGSVAEVPADHQVVVSASRLTDFKVRRLPQSVRSWRSSLPSGAIYGEWIPDGGEANGNLRTAPILLNLQKEPVTLHLAALSVSRGPAPPVVLTSGGRFRIRGQIETSADIYFGLTTKHVKGGFAGKYVAASRFDLAQKTQAGLEIELHIEEFRPQEEEFPDSPIGLELVDWWCFTYNVDAGLSIASVELLPPAPFETVQQPTTAQPQLPIMDIWTATSHGNLRAVKRHLAAGAEIDATFIAPGIPTSGATPLHLAVLSDQVEIARFLIEKGANLNAKAKDEHGGTPLHWAAVLGRIEMARRLIEAGADVNAKDNNGFTPLDATSYDGKSEKKARLKIAELLREKGGKSGAAQTNR